MSASIVVGIIGIFVAIVLVNYLMYIGVNPAVSAIIASAVICLTSGLNFVEAWDVAIGPMGALLGQLAPLFIFGGILGTIYTASGAADSLAEVLMLPAKRVSNPTAKVIVNVGMLMLFRVLLGLAGMDNLAIMATMVYVLVSIMHEADIPRKYANAILMTAGTVGSLVPGTASSANLILQESLENYKPTSDPVIRWLMLLGYIVVCVLIFTRLTMKSQKKGEHFDYGPLEHDERPDQKRPHWLLTLLPLLVVYLTYNVVGLPSFLALICGCVLALILFGVYIPKEEGKSRASTLLDCVNKGTNLVPIVILFTMLSGFFLTQSPSYDYLTSVIAAIPLPSAIILLLMAVILIGVAGMAGITLSAIFAVSFCIPAGVSVSACSIIIMWSTCVLDTLPNSLGIVMQNQLCGTTMRESYPSIFQTTVLVTGIFTALAAIIAPIGII
jgi:H+/gluconate symporter-like permease